MKRIQPCLSKFVSNTYLRYFFSLRKDVIKLKTLPWSFSASMSTIIATKEWDIYAQT